LNGFFNGHCSGFLINWEVIGPASREAELDLLLILEEDSVVSDLDR